LRVARLECEQLLFFSKRGLRMTISHLPIQGLTAPVTFAGTLTLALAEQIFLYLLHRAMYGDATLEFSANVFIGDPRTGAALCGRPEKQRINVAFAELARFYGCPCHGHCGHSDAWKPSFEAGALITALAVGEGEIKAGQGRQRYVHTEFLPHTRRAGAPCFRKKHPDSSVSVLLTQDIAQG